MASANFSATAAALASFQRFAPESQAWPSASKTRLSAAEAALAAYHSCGHSEASSDGSSTRASSGNHTPRAEAQQSLQPNRFGMPHLWLSGPQTGGARTCPSELASESQKGGQASFHAEVARQLEQYRADALEAANVKLERQLLDSELVFGDKDRVIASLQAALTAKDDLIAALEDKD